VGAVVSESNLPPETVSSPHGAPPGPPPGAAVSIDLTATPLPSSDSGSPRLRALGEMALCSSLPTQLAIGWTLRMAGWSPIDAAGNLQLGFVTALTLLDTVALVGLMVALMRARGERPSALWLGTRPVAREIVAGVTHVPIVFSIGAVLLLSIRALTPELHNVDVNPFEALAGSSVADAAMLTLVAIVAGGVREELQRAFLLDRFERYLGPAWLGVMLLSTAFGLGHLVQGQDAAIATGAMGAFWAVIYLKRRSSVAPMMSHALFNSLEVLLITAMRR
jgi:membrane protease YdiL (CAAX protease family)